MMKAEVSGNSIEVTFSPSEALLLGLSVLFVVVLTVLAGWQVALVALGLSLLGAGAVDAAQQADSEDPRKVTDRTELIEKGIAPGRPRRRL